MRILARMVAFQIFAAVDAGTESAQASMAYFLEPDVLDDLLAEMIAAGEVVLPQTDIAYKPITKSDLAYIRQTVEGFAAHQEEIDDLISTQSQALDWDFQRLGRVERSILRLATYEICYMEDIPAISSINEAVELAKAFAEANSYGFINRILDQIKDDKLGD